jgi:hypothetical protein
VVARATPIWVWWRVYERRRRAMGRRVLNDENILETVVNRPKMQQISCWTCTGSNSEILATASTPETSVAVHAAFCHTAVRSTAESR